MDENKPEDPAAEQAKAFNQMLEYHRSVIVQQRHDIRHAPTDSLQIVLLAAILDALKK